MRVLILVNIFLVLLLGSLPAIATDDTQNTYRLGAGYPVSNTGWRIGGYANAEIGAPRVAPLYFELTDLSLFLTWDNGSRLRFFSELEAGDLVNIGKKEDLTTQKTSFEFERFYLDSLVNSHLTIRLGKFLTPIGQWNTTHAAPLVWTTSRPVATENLFSPHASGLMLHGSVSVANRLLEYSVYGDVSEHIDPYRSQNPFQNALGAHIHYFLQDILQIGASLANYALNELQTSRYYLVGLDIAWSYRKFELSSELVYRASDQTRIQSTWQGFAQSVIPVSQHWFVVGRYEYFEQQQNKAGQVGVIGLAYRPQPPLVWKLEYRLGTHNELLAPDGLSGSVAILF